MADADSMDRDFEKISGGVKDTVDSVIRSGVEIFRMRPEQKKKVTVELSTGPLKDIDKVAKLLRKNPDATMGEIKDVIHQGSYLQRAAKLGLKGLDNKLTVLNRYDKTVYRKASLIVAKENLQQQFGQNVVERFKQTQRQQQQRSQQQDRRLDQGQGQGF